MNYSDIAWLPLSGGLTLLGLIASWFAWRRRGFAAGLRGVAWSLLPLAAYLLGVIKLLWNLVSAIVSFAGSFVFSPAKWAGVMVAILAVILFAVSGVLRGRSRKQADAKLEAASVPARPAAAGALSAGKGRPARAPAGKSAGADEDFSDVEQILRRRGIR